MNSEVIFQLVTLCLGLYFIFVDWILGLSIAGLIILVVTTLSLSVWVAIVKRRRGQRPMQEPVPLSIENITAISLPLKAPRGALYRVSLSSSSRSNSETEV